MHPTTHQRRFAELAARRLGGLTPAETVFALMEMGVINHKMCRVAVVRDRIASLRRRGMTVTDAMWTAAEEMALSYEFVRECVYYHRGTDFPQTHHPTTDKETTTCLQSTTHRPAPQK